MNVLTVFAYIFAALFLFVLFRVLYKEYWISLRIWWLEHVRGYEYFYFNKRKTKVLAKNFVQAREQFKASKNHLPRSQRRKMFNTK